MLAGDRIMLREIEEPDLDAIARWRNDPEVHRWLFSCRFISSAAQRQWYQRYLADEGQQTFLIVLRDGAVPIGTIGLSRISPRDRTGELGIMIGERGYRSMGFGAESLRVLIAYAFDQLGLRKIKALAFADNGPAVKLYESCGFMREGTLREEVYKDGRFRDVHVFGLIRDGADRR